jgi:uncharacterized protein involved in exopolysaccharide biosynthesis
MTPVREAWVRNLSIILNHKILITVVAVVSVALTAVYCFVFMPDWYQATAKVLPARHSGGLLESLGGGLSSTIKDLGISKIGGAGSEGSYSPLSLLGSRELREGIIRRFDLAKEYKARNMTEALAEFDQHVSGSVMEEGDIDIQFEDTNAVRAAAVTNALVDGVNDLNSRMAVEEAKQNFGFVDLRYKQNLADLDSAEMALGAFQRKYGVYELPEQAKAELSGVAAVEQAKLQTEMQLHTAEKIYGSASPEAQLLKSSITDLASKLGELNSGLDSKASYFVPTKVLPEVALQYLRLMREVEIQSKLKAFMLPTYEQAKLDQTKRALTFISMDHAVPPEKKSRPHRSIILIVAALSGVILTSLGTIVATNLKATVKKFNVDREELAGLA